MSTDRAKDMAQANTEGVPGLLSVWRHYKGGIYTVIATPLKEDTLERLVVYHSNQKGTTWARTLQDFRSKVVVDGGLRPRFERVPD